MTLAAQPTTDQVLACLADLTPRIRAARPAADRACRQPRDLMQALAAAGLFRLWLPAALGGLEVDAPSAIRIVEAAATIDGAVGWCLGPGNIGSIMAAYLPETAARTIYGGDWLVNGAGSVAGSGQAVTVSDGVRLTGRWAFATNSHDCPWLLGFFAVIEPDGQTPRLRPDGAPDLRFFYFPAHQATIIDTWDTGGLRGTASNDVVVDGVVVPESYSFATDATAWAPGPLFRETPAFWAAPAFAAIPLGIARAAITALTDLAGTKVPTGSRRLLREQALVRHELARAEASLRAARAFFYEAVTDAWAALASGRVLTKAERALVGLASSHATDTSRAVVQAMYQAGGGSSVYSGAELDRCLRDVQVAAQHAALGARNYEQAARVFLGMPLA